MTFLHVEDYAAWSLCPGRPALEESEGGRKDDVPRSDKMALAARKTALEPQGAVEVLPVVALDVGQITAERGALTWADIVLCDSQGHTRLEVYPEDKTLGLAAILKFSILHNITETNVGTPDELYLHGAKVTEAAALSLSLRNSITALEHLVPGDYCKTCLASYRCPALASEVHETVFPLQAPDDEDLTPVFPVFDEEVLAKVPLVETWLTAVTGRGATKQAKSPPPKKRRKRRARKPAA